jgi:nicotinamide mononucleotide transporter
MPYLEIVAFVVTVVSIFLGTREHVSYYPTGIVSVLLYAWIYFGAHLYAEAALQFVWLALMIYGWHEWLHGGRNKSELPVTRTTRWGWVVVAALGVILSAIIIAIQRRWTNNPAPWVDSSIAAWSIVAQWMTARKWIENWLLWIVINVAAVALYITRNLRITAVLYAILLLLGIEGYRKWRKSLVSF